MDQERGLYLGNKHWAGHYGKHWEHKKYLEEVKIMFSQQGMVMANLRTIVWGRQREQVTFDVGLGGSGEGFPLLGSLGSEDVSGLGSPGGRVSAEQSEGKCLKYVILVVSQI